MPATEIAGTDFPDQISTGFPMVAGDRSFPRIVVEAALLCTGIQAENGIGGQRAETHGGNVKHAGVVWLVTVSADQNPEIAAAQSSGSERVVHPLESLFVHAELGAKRAFVENILGPLIHDCALFPREGAFLGVGLDKVLADFGADGFEQVSEVRHDGVVPADGVLSLNKVIGAKGSKSTKDQRKRITCADKQDQSEGNEKADNTQYVGRVAKRKGLCFFHGILWLFRKTGSNGSAGNGEFSFTRQPSVAIDPDSGWSVIDHGL